MKRIVVLISGRGRNLQALIRACADGRVAGRVARVIANRADAAGLTYARAAGVPTQVISHRDYADRESFDRALLAAVSAEEPAAVVLAGFMRILTPVFVAPLQGRLLNIHPSLLPRYPGLDTHARALAAGDREHGATVHFVTEALDAGAAIIQGALRVRPDDSADTLARRVLEEIELRIYPQAVAWLLSGELQWRGGAWFRGRLLTQPLTLDALDPAFRS